MLFNFNNITYSLGPDRNRQVSVSGSVTSGGVMVVRGASGTGKSTLLRILARLQPGEKGEAFLHGESWLRIPGTSWRSKIHYMAQKPAFFDGTVTVNLVRPFEIRVLSGKQPDLSLAGKVTEELLLPSNVLDQDARTLSGGEAARLAFVRALLIDPHVMLLDEPTASLDNRSREAFYRVLRRWLTGPGKAAVLVSHNDDFKLLDRVTFIDLSSH